MDVYLLGGLDQNVVSRNGDPFTLLNDKREVLTPTRREWLINLVEMGQVKTLKELDARLSTVRKIEGAVSKVRLTRDELDHLREASLARGVAFAIAIKDFLDTASLENEVQEEAPKQLEGAAQ